MNELQFKKLLIDTIKIGDEPNKEEIIDLLKLVSIRFEKTGQFAYRGVWNQCQEFIYIKIKDIEIIINIINTTPPVKV